MHVKNAPRGRTVRTGSNACGHCDLLEFRRSRCAFPSVLSSVLKESSDTYVISGPIVTHVAPERQRSRPDVRTRSAIGFSSSSARSAASVVSSASIAWVRWNQASASDSRPAASSASA